jgi:hypothetical protein
LEYWSQLGVGIYKCLLRYGWKKSTNQWQNKVDDKVNAINVEEVAALRWVQNYIYGVWRVHKGKLVDISASASCDKQCNMIH